MAKYRGPVCKLCRREGEKLFLKGARCYTPKCAIDRRAYPPGMHGKSAQFRRKRESDYARQLRAKQKARRVYGVLERQFRRYHATALKRRGLTGLTMLQILESRLDNVVYRLGFAANRRQARQLVLHGHFTVNNKRVSIPSCLLRSGDIVGLKEASMKLNVVEENISKIEHRGLPAWIEMDTKNLKGKVLHAPERDEIDLTVQEQLIVELYSK